VVHIVVKKEIISRQTLEAAEHATGDLRSYRTKVGDADIPLLVRGNAGSWASPVTAGQPHSMHTHGQLTGSQKPSRVPVYRRVILIGGVGGSLVMVHKYTVVEGLEMDALQKRKGS
jgi:hypothetical protein